MVMMTLMMKMMNHFAKLSLNPDAGDDDVAEDNDDDAVDDYDAVAHDNDDDTAEDNMGRSL